MRNRSLVVRGLWVAVTVAVGLSFVGRPLAMRDAMLASQAAGQTAGGAGAQSMDMGHAHGAGMPCRQHDGTCCAPCLACCACCATVPAPAATPPSGAVALPAQPLAVSAAPAAVPPLGGRFLQPPPLGPPASRVG